MDIGDDYRCNECNRILANGMRNLVFTINIFNDNILEMNEEFMLINISTFVPSSSGIRVITGSPESVIVTIVDDDCELFECGVDVCICNFLSLIL